MQRLKQLRLRMRLVVRWVGAQEQWRLQVPLEVQVLGLSGPIQERVDRSALLGRSFRTLTSAVVPRVGP